MKGLEASTAGGLMAAIVLILAKENPDYRVGLILAAIASMACGLWADLMWRPRRDLMVTSQGMRLLSQEIQWADIHRVTLQEMDGDYWWRIASKDRERFTVANNEYALRSKLLRALSEHLPGFPAEAAKSAIAAKLDWVWMRYSTQPASQADVPAVRGLG